MMKKWYYIVKTHLTHSNDDADEVGYDDDAGDDLFVVGDVVGGEDNYDDNYNAVDGAGDGYDDDDVDADDYDDDNANDNVDDDDAYEDDNDHE